MALEALQQPQQQQHKILEMKAYRLASNKTDGDVAEILFFTLLQQLILEAPRTKEAFVEWLKDEETESD
ncbi:hypothetical protein ENH_00034400, partial [Eimeria necatrix]